MQSIQITRTNIMEVKDFLGEAYDNTRIERHPNGKVEIIFHNKDDKQLTATIGEFIVLDNNKFTICEMNPFTNKFQQIK